MRALALVIAALAALPAALARDLSATLGRPLGTPEADTLVAEASLTFEVTR